MLPCRRVVVAVAVALVVAVLPAVVALLVAVALLARTMMRTAPSRVVLRHLFLLHLLVPLRRVRR